MLVTHNNTTGLTIGRKSAKGSGALKHRQNPGGHQKALTRPAACAGVDTHEQLVLYEIPSLLCVPSVVSTTQNASSEAKIHGELLFSIQAPATITFVHAVIQPWWCGCILVPPLLAPSFSGQGLSLLILTKHHPLSQMLLQAAQAQEEEAR